MKYDAPMRFEVTASTQFLPRCPECGHKHPRAYMPPLRTNECPECGAPRWPPQAPVSAPAVVTDGRFRLGALMLRIGSKFFSLSGLR